MDKVYKIVKKKLGITEGKIYEGRTGLTRLKTDLEDMSTVSL